jgi:hypothetical protein
MQTEERSQSRRTTSSARPAITKVRRVGSGFHLEPMAVDSHGELLVVRYADALMRGTVELATRNPPPGCFAYDDEVVPMRALTGQYALIA